MRPLPEILILILLLFSLSIPLWAGNTTVMVNVVDVSSAPLKENDKENAGVLENGLMDSLFEEGIMFFSSSSRKTVEEMKSGNASLVRAVEYGTDYLIELSFEPEEEIILFAIYNVEEKILLKKGEIPVPKGTVEEKKEFCRKTGNGIAKEFYLFLDK